MEIRSVFSSAILFTVTLAFFAFLGIASSQCYSAIGVQLSTGERISLGDFEIYFNGLLVGYTGGHGDATIPIDSEGSIAITTSKEVGGVRYEGSNSAQIPCVKASGGRLRITIPVSAQGEGPSGEGSPWPFHL